MPVPVINKQEIDDIGYALTDEAETMRVFHGERHPPLDDGCKFE